MLTRKLIREVAVELAPWLRSFLPRVAICAMIGYAVGSILDDPRWYVSCLGIGALVACVNELIDLRWRWFHG